MPQPRRREDEEEERGERPNKWYMEHARPTQATRGTRPDFDDILIDAAPYIYTCQTGPG